MKVKYIVLSDIHLGHNNTSTQYIINNLNTEIFKHKDIDIIFIAGDLFHRLLDFNQNDVYDIVSFLYRLLIHCYNNNIILRVLEGTPSHDWQQSKIILELNNNLKTPIDVKYISKLEIEYIEKYNINVLYIPDEWSNDIESLEKEIRSELISKNIEQCDIAILHGLFNYQDPFNHVSFKYREEFFLNIIKHYINIGHYHTHSFFNRIIAQGSFDRLSHGEEEPKGYCYIEIDTKNKDLDKWTFIENKNAKIYKTFIVNNKTSIENLTKKILSLPHDSHIRLKINENNPFNNIYEEFKLKLYNYNIKKQIIQSDKINALNSTKNDKTKLSMTLSLNRDNIKELLKNSILERGFDFNKEHWNIFDNYIYNMLNQTQEEL